MKKVIILYFVLGNIACEGVTALNFIINSEINGIEEGATIRLYSDGFKYFAKDTINLATATVRNGKFQLTGQIERSGGRYYLRNDNSGVPLIHIYLDSGSNIILKGNANKRAEIVIIDKAGLGTQNDRSKYLKVMGPLIKRLNSSGLDKNRILENILKTQVEFIKTHINSYYTPSIMMNVSDDLSYYFSFFSRYPSEAFSMPYEKVKELFGILSEKVKNSEEGVKLNERIYEKETALRMSTADEKIGEKFPDLKLYDQTGATVNVAELLKNESSNLTILFLWEPETYTSVKEIEFLNDVSKKYGKSSINIISVDRCACFLFERNSFVNKVEEESGKNIEWHQLVDLRRRLGNDNGLSYAHIFFRTRKKTFLALVNNEGRIVAEDLSIQQTEQKLKEILGK